MRIGALGMSKKELAACAAGAQTLGKDCVVGFRYEADKLSRPVHIEAMQRLLNAPENESNEPVQRFRYHELQGSGHSTVTGNPPDDTVVQEILAFLEERL